MDPAWPGAAVQNGSAGANGQRESEGDSALASFSPRSQRLAIYLIGDFGNRHHSALTRLGPHQTGRGCLYIKRLDEVDQDTLRELIDRSVRVRKGLDQASS